MSIFQILTPVSYWCLIVLWSFILIFYIRRLLSSRAKNSFLTILIVILLIDAFRTLFESTYFGAWYSAKEGFLPYSIYEYLLRK